MAHAPETLPPAPDADEDLPVFRRPKVDSTAWVSPHAFVSGDVTLARDASVWPMASVRGDMEPIVIGEGSNVQDGAALHTSFGYPLEIGRKVTIGHAAVVHSASYIGEGTLIGMNATVLDGARIGKGCLIAAGAVVTPGTEIPDHSLVAGVPGKVVKTSEKLYAANMHNHESYVRLKELYREGRVPIHGSEG